MRQKCNPGPMFFVSLVTLEASILDIETDSSLPGQVGDETDKNNPRAASCLLMADHGHSQWMMW